MKQDPDPAKVFGEWLCAQFLRQGIQFLYGEELARHIATTHLLMPIDQSGPYIQSIFFSRLCGRFMAGST